MASVLSVATSVRILLNRSYPLQRNSSFVKTAHYNFAKNINQAFAVIVM